MKFCEKIKKLRLEYNLTQEELANLLFVSRNAVSKWENDLSYPNLDSLKLISKKFNVSIDNLLNDEDLITIALKNKEERINIIKIIILFFSYSLNGILFPFLCFKLDPTSVMSYSIVIGPLSFLLLGVITSFYNRNIKHVIITSLISLLPIFIYFENTMVKMIYLELVFYLIFLFSYFLFKKLKK